MQDVVGRSISKAERLVEKWLIRNLKWMTCNYASCYDALGACNSEMGTRISQPLFDALASGLRKGDCNFCEHDAKYPKLPKDNTKSFSGNWDHVFGWCRRNKEAIESKLISYDAVARGMKRDGLKGICRHTAREALGSLKIMYSGQSVKEASQWSPY